MQIRFPFCQNEFFFIHFFSTRCFAGFLSLFTKRVFPRRSGATVREDCSLPICTPGSFLNSTLNECVRCPRGFYQDEAQQTDCYECPPDTSTKGDGAASAEECTNR